MLDELETSPFRCRICAKFRAQANLVGCTEDCQAVVDSGNPLDSFQAFKLNPHLNGMVVTLCKYCGAPPKDTRMTENFVCDYCQYKATGG